MCHDNWGNERACITRKSMKIRAGKKRASLGCTTSCGGMCHVWGYLRRRDCDIRCKIRAVKHIQEAE
jgi:hypothetical protein